MSTNIGKKDKSNMANIASTSELDSAKKSKDKSLAIAGIEKKPLEFAEQLDGRISNRWVQYGVKKNARLIARKLTREELNAEIRRLDPVNAEQIIKRSAQQANE